MNSRYQLDNVIGEGGMAVVYHGHDLLLNREVAVKILREEYAENENFLRRFEREGQIAAGLSHPNLVSVYDVGHHQDSHYIVMEYVKGPNLKNLIMNRGPFSVDGAVFIIEQVAVALDYAHQRGLVHRDIKPQNILVDRFGNAKVVDFGIAKGLRDPNLTETGTGMGTVHYVSPEQARGEIVGPASDLYSTGIVLFEMLTRTLPFDADTPVGVAMHHVSTTPPLPSSINPQIPRQIDSIVMKALAKRPEDRYSSAAAFRAALRNWHEQPIGTNVPAGREARAARSRSRPAVPHRRDAPIRHRTAATATRNEVGCGTWIVGSILLIAILAIVIAALKWGPDLFETGPAITPSITSTTDQEPASAQSTTTSQTSASDTGSASASSAPASPPTLTIEPTMTSGPEIKTVPDLRNANESQARAEVGSFWLLLVEEDFSDSISPGLVVRQEPAPELTLEQGETITIWVSKGPQEISIPDVRGITEDEAVGQLDDLGFDVTVATEPSETVGEGLVTRTEPEVIADFGSEIVLYVSEGDVVVVPNVYEIEVMLATAILEQTGLSVRSVLPQSCAMIQRQDPVFDCEAFPSGAVVSASLEWNAVVPRSTIIDIVYFQGADTSP